ncbi:DUF5682 family protein [Nocardioides sp. TF02-7]|uniref:DUF5682 family protein n=1 Tax=Nocardioides sp. TF02-7 TaxID=2917724 RepID=UPI001F05B09A|nr:DUF5682 family protein [Nocardioides sp. TF02-7]UMG94612.1 DUF5682 family protein [Nocardioides sp. TF02-7]
MPGAVLTATTDSAAGEPRVEVLGIRHHGPGSARSVAAALAELEPTLVVIEGPPELDAVAGHAADPGLVPPVAGLVYATDEPRRAAFYPMAAFSPEWVALRWAADHDVPVRFADLPAAHALAGGPDERVDRDEGGDEDEGGADADAPPRRPAPAVDPIGTLARAAGYDDAERWWEDAVEHRADSTLERFALLREAMTSARAAAPVRDDDLRREAAMRRVIRAARKEGHPRVAVVCGAYHAPVLDPATFPSAAADNRLLTRLPRVKVTATWAPWTAGRLALSSGYGAGVTSPGVVPAPVRDLGGRSARRRRAGLAEPRRADTARRRARGGAGQRGRERAARRGAGRGPGSPVGRAPRADRRRAGGAVRRLRGAAGPRRAPAGHRRGPRPGARRGAAGAAGRGRGAPAATAPDEAGRVADDRRARPPQGHPPRPLAAAAPAGAARRPVGPRGRRGPLDRHLQGGVGARVGSRSWRWRWSRPVSTARPSSTPPRPRSPRPPPGPPTSARSAR